MKNDKALWGSISILVGIVIAILAVIKYKTLRNRKVKRVAA